MDGLTSKRKKINYATGILACCGLLLLSGCGQMGGTFGGSDGGDKSAAPKAVATYQPRQGISAQERFRVVLELLEEGRATDARAELELYLRQQPKNERGLDLLQQIDLPAAEYFPSEYREVQLAPGQSLSSVAYTYLGSLYKFYALAKYNDITEPRRIRVGQTIRVPLTDQAMAVFTARQDATDTAEVESTLEAAAASAAPDPNVPVMEEAVSVELEESEESMDADSMEAVAVETEEVAEGPDLRELHREALNAYRAQDLTRAIQLWDQVLIVDPEFENASLYRAQAIQLQKKLRNLK